MIYSILLVIHNALRWLVVGSLLASLGMSFSGLVRQRTYQPLDQTLRVVATSIAHTQLLVGFYLYAKSPIVSYYWKAHPTFADAREFPFFQPDSYRSDDCCRCHYDDWFEQGKTPETGF